MDHSPIVAPVPVSVASLPEAAARHALSEDVSRADLRNRSMPNPVALDHIARMLFEKYDPFAEETVHKVAMDEVTHFYAPRVLDTIDRRLAMTVQNRSRLFVQGEQGGVGTSQLVVDYARAFNALAEEHHDPRRILYVRVAFGTRSILRFLDDFAIGLGTVFSSAMLSRRGFGRLTEALVAAMRSARVTTMIIDHPHHLALPIRGIIGEIIREADPDLRASTGIRSHAPLPRIGVVVVSHADPATVFRGSSDVLPLFTGNYVALRKYREPEDVLIAMEQADIGFERSVASRDTDLELAATVLELSDGMPSNMQALFGILGALWRKQGRRPDLAGLAAGVRYYDQLLGPRAKRDAAEAAKVELVQRFKKGAPERLATGVASEDRSDITGPADDAPTITPPNAPSQRTERRRIAGNTRADVLKSLNDTRSADAKLKSDVVPKRRRSSRRVS